MSPRNQIRKIAKSRRGGGRIVNAIHDFSYRCMFSCENSIESCSWDVSHVYVYELCGRGFRSRICDREGREGKGLWCGDAELLSPAAFGGVVAIVPAISLGACRSRVMAPMRSVFEIRRRDRGNNRSSDFIHVQVFIVAVVFEHAVARTVFACFCNTGFGYGEQVAAPHAPVFPARVVEFGCTGCVTLTDALFAAATAADHACACAEVVAVV